MVTLHQSLLFANRVADVYPAALATFQHSDDEPGARTLRLTPHMRLDLLWSVQTRGAAEAPRLAWRCRSGLVHEGIARFDTVGEQGTRVQIYLALDPYDPAVSDGDALTLEVKHALQDFKQLIDAQLAERAPATLPGTRTGARPLFPRTARPVDR